MVIWLTPSPQLTTWFMNDPSEKPSENSSQLPIEPRTETEIGSEIIDKNIPDTENTTTKKKVMRPRLPLNVYYYPIFIPHYSWGYAF